MGLTEKDRSRLARAVAAGHRGVDVPRRIHRRWDRLRRAGFVESGGKGALSNTGAWTVITYCATPACRAEHDRLRRSATHASV